VQATNWMARWFPCSFAYPPGAKLTFPVSFPPAPLCSGWGGRCVAEASSSAGTGRTVSPAMASLPKRTSGYLLHSSSLSPHPVAHTFPNDLSSKPYPPQVSSDLGRFRPCPEPPTTLAPSDERAGWRPWSPSAPRALFPSLLLPLLVDNSDYRDSSQAASRRGMELAKG
jgi:hypothetical protein